MLLAAAVAEIQRPRRCRFVACQSDRPTRAGAAEPGRPSSYEKRPPTMDNRLFALPPRRSAARVLGRQAGTVNWNWVNGRTLRPTPWSSSQCAPRSPRASVRGSRRVADQGGPEGPDRRASGGVGTFAVQIAKALGAHVTAVCSTRNVDQARALGADQVIDTPKTDFTRSGKRYDVILDVASSGPLSARRRILEPNGILVGVGNANGGTGMASIVAGLIETAVVSRFGSQKMPFFLAKNSKEDLLVLKEMIEAGKIKPVIDRMYPLTETADALRYLEAGHARGKVVITV
jgi:hypothetical protein